MIKKEEFKNLRSVENPNCVSIYIPTEITGDYEKNRIRWKNALQEVENKLEEKGINKTSFLKPAFDLIKNPDFWAHQSSGLVGFYAEDFAEYYHLNINPETQTLIDDSFYVAPLLKEMLNEDRIFILGVSKNKTQFYEAVSTGIFPVRIHDVVVKDMDEALNIDEHNQSLQHHSAGGKSIFHGNGLEGKEEQYTENYLRRIDDGLMEFIHDERVPLVLASVEEYHPIYKKVTKYNYFSDHMIAGNPDNMTPAQLRDQIQPLFDELKEKRIQSFLDEYNEKQNSNLVADQLSEIKQDAEYKNIDKLLVCQSYLNSLEEKDMETFNEIALSVYDNGGKLIVTSDHPGNCNTIHAIKRFEMETA